MLTEGSILSHYKVVSAIGAGGMGEVYLAEDTKLGRQVALKVLLSEVSTDQERVGRFVQEAKAASALNHPNILTVHEIGNSDGAQYIATEYIRGETLRERMKGPPLSLLEAFDISLQITAALGAAHDAGIIHRDIKPENIMIRGDGLVKVLDFGLAKLQPFSTGSVEITLPQHKTKSGIVVGTVAYMSPEQARGRSIDPRSDIFSLGIVLFELFGGRRPFEGDNHLDLVSSILKDEPPMLRDVAPATPSELERIVDRTLRKDREHRYQSIKDLHLDLEDLRDELKFEAKLNRVIQPTIEASVHHTDQDSSLNRSNLRSALTTGLSKTPRFTLLHALILVGLFSGLLGGVWYWRSGKPALGMSAKTTDVAVWTSAPGELYSGGSFSPEGKLIAFDSTRSGTKGIWVTQAASMEAIPVTNDEFANTNPVWSPKGDEIAYISRRPKPAGDFATGVWRVSALGGTPRYIGVLTDGSSRIRRWLASGKLYYQAGPNLYAMDVATGTSTLVVSLQYLKPNWINIAPDEKTVAYTIGTDTEWKIFSMDVGGTRTKEIVKGSGRLNNHIAWLPEKDRFFFSAVVDEVPGLYVAAAGSGRAERFAAPEIENSVVDAAPDGGSVLLSSSREESSIWSVTLAGAAETTVSKDLNATLWPAISHDGTKVVFQSIKNLSGGNKLFRAGIAVKPLKPVGESVRPNVVASDGFLPSWSPDGTAVTYLKLVGREMQLFSAGVSGGGERPLSGPGVGYVSFSVSPYNAAENPPYTWSPDGASIAFVGEREGVWNISLISRPDWKERQLTNYAETGHSFASPVWSSDGKRIAFSFQKKPASEGGRVIRGLRILDIATGSVTDLMEAARSFRLLGWTSDENGLIIAEPSTDFTGIPPQTRFIRVPLAGPETLIAELKNIYIYNVFLSPDRKQIAYAARTENIDDIWVTPAAGGTARRLTNNKDPGLYFSKLTWTPNGEAIIFGKQTRFSLLSMLTNIE